MTKRAYLIGSEVAPVASLSAPPADAPVIRLVMHRWRPYTGTRPDHAAMRDAAHRAVGTSKQIAARAAKAEQLARAARETAAVRAQVQTAFRPPAGRLFGVDVEALILTGPGGGIGVTPILARSFAILAAPGRHMPESLVAAGWRDVDHLHDGLAAFAGKLGAVGLSISRRRTGLRVAKLKAAEKSAGRP